MAARVLTLNIWNLSGPWTERRDEIVRWIDLLDPDLVCLQEVVENPDGRNQAQWIGQHAATAYRCAYAGRPVGNGNLFGNAILSRWDVDGDDSLDLPDSPFPEDTPRVLLHARTNGLDVFCTHLAWRLDDSATRQRQVVAVAEAVAARSDPDGPVTPVLCGDMNADPESTEIRFLKGQATIDGRSSCFIDAWAASDAGTAGGGGGWTWDNRNPFAHKDREPNRRIDYIFVGWRPNCGVWPRAARVVCDRALSGTFPTDHMGLMAEVISPG